jgi:transposase
MRSDGVAMDAAARIAELEAALSARDVRIVELERERDRLREAHERTRLELELIKRRLFVAKAERIDTAQLELEFAAKLRQLEELAGTLGKASSEDDDGAPDGSERPTHKRKPTGRRNLDESTLPVERVEMSDPLFDELVAQGKAEAIGYEESRKLAWQRGGMKLLVVARTKYRTLYPDGESALATTEMPKELFPRSLAAPSLLAHIVTEKFCDGLPLHRLEDRFARDGVPLDRGTMCRWLEDAGATLGATVVAAMRDDALRTAFCIATDATGVAVQPVRTPGKYTRQACRRAHFFVQLADRDHAFFEYTPRETSAAVSKLFEGFSGYVQADAKSVYDALFREPDGPDGDDPPDGIRHEVGCWSHARRKFWEAACAKSEVAREGLYRVRRIFELDAAWRGRPHAEVRRLRDAHLRAHVDDFFAWVDVEYEKVEHQRGLVRDALGYAHRQKHALTRFLDDGRLLLDNNRSERELRRVAVGRKAWLFVGSDDHGESTSHLFTLVASARLHHLDPEAYLRDLVRVLPHWPRERYLELAPKHWAATRARLDAAQLERELGALDVPVSTVTP